MFNNTSINMKQMWKILIRIKEIRYIHVVIPLYYDVERGEWTKVGVREVGGEQ